jgi:hypothetical protein
MKGHGYLVNQSPYRPNKHQRFLPAGPVNLPVLLLEGSGKFPVFPGIGGNGLGQPFIVQRLD